MTRWMRVVVVGLGLVGSSALAQFDAEPAADPNRPKLQINIGEDVLINAAGRVVDQWTTIYGLDEDQAYLTRDLVRSRVRSFLAENGGEVNRVVNDYLKAYTADEPPSPEWVADFAARADTLLKKFTPVVDDVATGMREYLDPEQQTILDGQLAAFDGAQQLVETRLENWQNGGFDAQTEWVRGADFKQAEAERVEQMVRKMRDARDTAMGVPPTAGGAAPGGTGSSAEPSRPDVARTPLTADEWEQYVSAFIAKYQLTPEQTTRARQFLIAAQSERERYNVRSAPTIVRVRKAYENAKTPEQKERVEAQFRKLNAPLERIFTQLKDSLEKLPTRAQRAAAERAPAAPTEKRAALKSNP